MSGSSPRFAPRFFRGALIVVAGFHLISAMIGAIGLTAFGGMGVPLRWLDGTPFTSYFWPGVILGVVVGGSQAIALFCLLGRYRLARGASAAAGLVMMIWIFVEIALMLVWSPLHGVFFVTGTVQVVLAVLALGAWPSPLFAREPTGDESSPAGSRHGVGG